MMANAAVQQLYSRSSLVVYITLQISYLRCDDHVESQAQVPILQGETIHYDSTAST